MENGSCPLPVEVGSLNVSEYDFPEAAAGGVWEWLLKSAAYALVLGVALAGNVLVLAVVACNAHMRTTVNCYLVSLAVADLAIALLCMWTHLLKHLAYPHYLLGLYWCRVDAAIHMTALTSSVLTMTAISCDRFFAVMCPLRARFTKQRSRGVISAIWLFSVASSLPFILHRQYSEIKWKNYVQPQCDDVWTAQTRYDAGRGVCVVDYPTKRLYYIFFSVALFMLPITIMSVTYSLLVRKLWLSPPPGERSHSSIQSRAKKKVIKLVVALLVVFMVCWTPLQVLTLYGVFGHVPHVQGDLPRWFTDFEFVAYFIAYSNSAANPIIYCGFNNNFRRTMAAMLFGVCLRKTRLRGTKFVAVCDRQKEPPSAAIQLATLYQQQETKTPVPL